MLVALAHRDPARRPAGVEDLADQGGNIVGRDAVRFVAFHHPHGGLCIWEGESVDAVREVVEGAVGPWAQNEYYEMHVDGLTPQLGN
jgi:hypothetical protein